MEKKVKIGIAIIIAILCLGAVGYAVVEHENNSNNNQNDGSDSLTVTATMTLGDYNGVVPTGEHFIGWSTTAVIGIGVTANVNYKANTTITLPTTVGDKEVNKLTLYPVFASNSCTISFNNNGGSASMENITATYGNKETIVNCDMTYAGHNFKNWNTQADGKGTTYTVGSSVDTLIEAEGASVTLYAQWTACTYDVTYHIGANTAISSNATSTTTEGIDGTVTYGTDLTITYDLKFTPDDYNMVDGKVIKLTITIGGKAYGDYTEELMDSNTGSITIAGADITGDIVVTTEKVNCFTVAYFDYTDGAVDKDSEVDYNYYTLANSYKDVEIQDYKTVYPDDTSGYRIWWFDVNGKLYTPWWNITLTGDIQLYALCI